MQTETPTGITYPSILAERKVAITPMNGFTRFAGTMEIAGINHSINTNRVDAIAEGVTQYFPDVTISEKRKIECCLWFTSCFSRWNALYWKKCKM